MSRVASVGSMVLSYLAAACGAPPESTTDVLVVDEAAEVLIATNDDQIGQISDLVVAPDGQLYLVDQQSDQIHVVDVDGVSTSFGRSGEGPGELSGPTTIRINGDTLWVVDRGNGRLQGFSKQGEYLAMRPIPPQTPVLGPGGTFVRPTLGIDSALAVVHDATLNAVAFIGSIVGEPTNRVHPASMKEQIGRGEVPNVFLNTAIPLVGDDGFIWLVVPSRGSIQRFDPEGNELWTLSLEEPEAQDIFDRFVEANATSGARFPPLNYVLDAFIVSRGLWVLLGHSADGPAALRLVRMDGEVGERVEFPQISGVHVLAVDEGRGFVYFVRGGSAELIRVDGGPAV